ncbi:hypothetical protein ES705_14805 [subsurface metagenome]
MKKLLFLIACLLLIVLVNAQTTEILDTLCSPTGIDTLYHFPGYTNKIVGALIDFRTIDDTTGARVSFGAGWNLYDTTFFEIIGPTPIKATNDYILGLEKQGIGFSYPRLKFTKGSSAEDLKYPIKITYDR